MDAHLDQGRRHLVELPGQKWPLGYITSWKNSLSAYCQIHHGKCARPYSVRQLTSQGECGEFELKAWLLAGLQTPTNTAHMALAKPFFVGACSDPTSVVGPEEEPKKDEDEDLESKRLAHAA